MELSAKVVSRQDPSGSVTDRGAEWEGVRDLAKKGSRSSVRDQLNKLQTRRYSVFDDRLLPQGGGKNGGVFISFSGKRIGKRER